MKQILLGEASGRKLRGLYASLLAVLCLVVLGCLTLSEALLQSAILAGLAAASTLFAAFVGANVGEHVAKRPPAPTSSPKEG